MTQVDEIAPEPSEPTPVLETAGGTIPRAVSSPLLTHGGITIPHFFAMHVTGAGFCLLAGLMLYGWRALGSIAVILATTTIAIVIWRRIGSRGQQLHYGHTLWLALLLGLTLPPHLLTDTYHLTSDTTIATWPLLPASGLLIVPMIWFLGGLGSGRLHPVLMTHLLLVAFFGTLLVPHLVLQRSRVFAGDVMDSGKPGQMESMRGTWFNASPLPNRDAFWVEDTASEKLCDYTSPLGKPARVSMSLETLVRDEMPPLQDLIIGGHPGPMGTSCAIAVIIGGLFMLYRAVIDYRIPLLIIVSAYVAILLLPVPITIHESVRHWESVVVRQPSVGMALAVTFANYELMASPLLFTAFFLATSPAVRPMTRRGRTVYAIFIGVSAAALQLYFSVSIGPYIALLIGGILASALDRFFWPKTLV
ncbi:MAG TPA: RnfABCDGE type electron transport complex subunit D [Tepidisphaeraceae bacterium]|jgi:Na+-translocating ferredoxin:NAD+ oxidoreductase RnfD subunit|nr:RnfABCDGE type electron transport complex subunit D [Tepidisphaeraceae bacterium]